jgi:predicted GH43/DUF377 family glycosyl hydrolase
MMKPKQRNNSYQELFHRSATNPILTAADWPYPVNSVFNPGATRLADGTTLLLCRVEDRRGLSHFGVARSRDGISDWEIDDAPTLLPDPERYPEEIWGIEDPRITYVPEIGKYVIVYTSYSVSGPGVSLALTEDFRNFERRGVVMPPEDKDAAVLPRRIRDQWVLIHRPVSHITGTADMWISYSSDLNHWGEHRLMLEARRGGWWDANKIGLSPQPIETDRGWLVIYHGVRRTAAGSLYRLGLALFELEDPSRCIQRGDEFVFHPEEEYERHGDVDHVVFPCGVTVGDDGDTLYMYYGGADSCIGLATASIQTLLDWLEVRGQFHGRRLTDQMARSAVPTPPGDMG